MGLPVQSGKAGAPVKILMLVATSVATDTRVLREAQTLAEAGHAVHVIGRAVPGDFVPPAGVTVSSVGDQPTLPATAARVRRTTLLYRVARWLLLPRHRAAVFGAWAEAAHADAQGREFDVVHAHDFTALAVGAELARASAVPYVYDTHEYWPGRPRQGRPTPLANRREIAQERVLGGQARVVITVGEGVAAALRRRYGWDNVEVVRNTFPLNAQLQPIPEPTGLVYAGRIAADREIEVAIEAAELLDLPVTLLGPADEQFLARLRTGKVTVLGAEPVDEVTKRLQAAGLALVSHSDRWENHRLALPNKLFHAIHAGVPVVATDVDELAAVVRRYGIGTLYRPGDHKSLAAAVEAARTNYAELCAAVAAAQPELSWDVDGPRLVQALALAAP